MGDFDCHAPETVFMDLMDDLPSDIRRAIHPSGLPCEGTGLIAPYCLGCFFGEPKYTPEWFDSAYEDEEALEFGLYND